MENKIWHMGDFNVNTGLIFWAYQDKAHTNEKWVTEEKFKELKNKKRKYSNEYYRKYKELRKDRNRQLSRQSYYKRKEHNPLLQIYTNAKGRHFKRKAKDKNFDFSITVDDLREIFDKQRGKCFYCGETMQIAGKKSPFKMSLDRIDSAKGYTKENSILCCQLFNYGKNSYSLKELQEFFKTIYNNKYFIAFINNNK